MVLCATNTRFNFGSQSIVAASPLVAVKCSNYFGGNKRRRGGRRVCGTEPFRFRAMGRAEGPFLFRPPGAGEAGARGGGAPSGVPGAGPGGAALPGPGLPTAGVRRRPVPSPGVAGAGRGGGGAMGPGPARRGARPLGRRRLAAVAATAFRGGRAANEGGPVPARPSVAAGAQVPGVGPAAVPLPLGRSIALCALERS